MREAPILETGRLRLRPHRLDDLEVYHAMWSLPEVNRYTSGRGLPLTREQAWDAILRQRGLWATVGFGFWIIEEKDSGRLVGEAGVQARHRDIRPSIDGTLEAGWVLLPAWQGRGLAREAMEAAIKWCGSAHPGKALTCIIDPANEPSLKLAERLGFALAARTTYKDRPTVLLRRG